MATLLDATVRHSVYVTRHASHIANRMVALLNRTEPDLVAQIMAALGRLPAESFTVERLELMLASFRSMNAALHQQVRQALTGDLTAFATYEAGFQARLLGDAAGVSFTAATGEQVMAAALSRPFQGVLLREALAGVEASAAKRVRDAIRIGYVEGEPIDQIVRRIKGTRSAGYADGILEWPRRDIATVTRTAVSHTASVARAKTYESMDVKRFQWVSVLDSKTSLVCMGRSGKVYEVGKGPLPPAHMNCRSTTIPLLPGQEKLFGQRPALDYSDGRPKAKLVDANTTFAQWLKTQPAEVADDMLGSTRAKLWRDGKITLDRFTDSRGRVLSLDELRRRDASLFPEERKAA